MNTLPHDGFLSELARLRGDRDVVIATMTAGMLWPGHSTHDLDLCSMAPMGGAAPVGLGIALARPDVSVFVIDGDGELLMNLGALVTIGGQRPGNLLHVVLENGGMLAEVSSRPAPSWHSVESVDPRKPSSESGLQTAYLLRQAAAGRCAAARPRGRSVVLRRRR